MILNRALLLAICLLVLLQPNIVVFSGSVSVPGKARLAGNGCSPCQEAQRRPGALTDPPEGRSRAARPLRYRACQGLRHCRRTAPYGRAARER